MTDSLITCPECGGDVYGHGTRPRQAKATEGDKQCQVRRFCCTECGTSFTRLPDYLLPDKQYVASEIEDVLHHMLNGGNPYNSSSKADVRTQRRWWDEFCSKMQQWASLLESMADELLNRAPSLFRDSNPLKRLEETLSRLPALPSWWTVLVKTLWWLKTSHQLCHPRPP